MKRYVARSPGGAEIVYEDRKRFWWLLSVCYPLQPFVGIALHAASGNQLWLLLPLAFTYLGGPLLDRTLGEDRNNPPPAVVPQLERDRYYRRLTCIAVPLHFAAFIGAAWWAGSQPLSPWAFAGLAIVAGMTSGLAINTGHELGHKNSRLERTLSQLVLAIPAYGHFSIDHNRGHHRDVATPEDVASARMGESIYRFALREMPGALARAWAIETARLDRRGMHAWHPANRILRTYALTAVLHLVPIAVFGWKMLPWLLLHDVLAWWQLTSANYIEHYGLLRAKGADGRYERCQPHHSWNSNHTFSNLALFHLARHSDHHAHPSRRFQSLRNFDDLPSLPSGYFGAYLLACVPPLWYRVMDPRLMALPQVRHDISRVNVVAGRRERLARRYGATPG